MKDYDSMKIKVEITISDTAGWDVDFNDEKDRIDELKSIRLDLRNALSDMGIDEAEIKVEMID